MQSSIFCHDSAVSSKGNHRHVSPVRVLVVDDFEPFRRLVCSTVRNRPEVQVIAEAADGLVLYFEKPEDALLFTLAASSVMSAEGAVHSSKAAVRVAQEICKANRITTEGALNIT
jgi:hypothetical protein